MMPILPDLCDTDENLEAVVRWTAEHGGKFVLAGGLTSTVHSTLAHLTHISE